MNFWIKCGLLPQCGLDLEFFGCSPFISSSISSCFWKTMANFKTCQWVVAIPWLGEYIYFAGESSSGSSGIPDSSGGDSRSRHAVGNAQPQSQSCMSEPLSYYRVLLLLLHHHHLWKIRKGGRSRQALIIPVLCVSLTCCCLVAWDNSISLENLDWPLELLYTTHMNTQKKPIL